MLNASVHHEMLAPLKANLEIAMRLLKSLKREDRKQMARTIIISSQILMLHANDLLDIRIIENGSFEPNYASDSVNEAIKEITAVVQMTLMQRNLTIDCNKMKNPIMKFDRRRL